MQTYIVSFAVFLCIGITMRLIHPESYQLATPYVISAAFSPGRFHPLIHLPVPGFSLSFSDRGTVRIYVLPSRSSRN